MPDSKSQEPQTNESEASVDLSALKSFSFGTQWSEASKSSGPGHDSRPSRGAPRGGQRPDRRPGGGPPSRDRRPQRAPREGGEQRGDAPRFDGAARHDGPRGHGRGRPQGQSHPPFRPYESPVFDVCFYPDDTCFSAIIKAMRGNHLTYELFQVAKLFMEKPDRFIASITRKAEKGAKPEKVFICAEDGLPFATEEEVVNHAMNTHAEKYFSVEEIEVEPPTGNFPFVNRCPFTKELLGPPNYHKYEETLRKHHSTRLPNMSFEKLQASIETVRDEEVVQQWLDSQKKATRYTTKDVPEGEEVKSFNSIEEAAAYLRTAARNRVVKPVSYARVPGSLLESNKDTEAFKAMDGERMRQQRFPLDTANAIRGRMRREKFSIYKKGSKGVTYVCATKRNFRTPGQVMAPDLDRIIKFLESHQMVKAKEFPAKFAEWLKTESPDETVEEKKMQRDVHWLVADGYVSHFEDDSLFVQPVLETGAAERSDKAAGESGGRRAGKGKTAPESAAPAATEGEATPAVEKGAEDAQKTVDDASVAATVPDPVSGDERAASNDVAAVAKTPVQEPSQPDDESKSAPEVQAKDETSAPDEPQARTDCSDLVDEIQPEADSKKAEPSPEEASGEAKVEVESAPEQRDDDLGPEMEDDSVDKRRVGESEALSARDDKSSSES